MSSASPGQGGGGERDGDSVGVVVGGREGGAVGLGVGEVEGPGGPAGQITISSIPASTMSPLPFPSEDLTRSFNSVPAGTAPSYVAFVHVALVATSPIDAMEVQLTPLSRDASSTK